MQTETLIRPSAGDAGLPTVCAAFQASAARYPNRVALRVPTDGIEWSWDEYAVRVRRGAQTLHALGVRHGDRVALLLADRPEHLLADLAAVHLGATPFSIDGTLAAPQVEYIVRDSGACVLISEVAYEATAAVVAARCDALRHVVRVTSGAPELDGVDSPGFDFEQSWRAVTPTDLVCLVYGWGTTARPRRTDITHEAILAGLRGTLRALPAPERVTVVSFLPLANPVARFACHYMAIALAGTLTCCPDAAGGLGEPEVAAVADARAPVAALEFSRAAGVPSRSIPEPIAEAQIKHTILEAGTVSPFRPHASEGAPSRWRSKRATAEQSHASAP